MVCVEAALRSGLVDMTQFLPTAFPASLTPFEEAERARHLGAGLLAVECLLAFAFYESRVLSFTMAQLSDLEVLHHLFTAYSNELTRKAGATPEHHIYKPPSSAERAARASSQR